MKSFSANPSRARLSLQVGLAFVFLYAAYSSWTHPQDWTIFVPSLLVTLAPVTTIIKLIALYEVVLGVWLLSGKYLRAASALSALTLTGIVVLTPSEFMTTFRDVGLLLASVALFFL